MKMEDETNKPILKVSDKVRIKSKEWFTSQYKSNREDIEPPEEYNRPFFDFMEQYCGNICTIKYIYSNNVIKFNESDEAWESWMFDIVEPAHEYKVGDKVRIKPKEWFDSQPKDRDGDIPSPNEKGLYFTTKMSNFCGEVFTIESIDDFCIYLEENNEGWKPWMFDLVDEDKIEVGDLVTNKDKIQYVIVENLSESNYYYALDVEHWNAAAINKKENLIIVEKGKYKDLINTKLPLETRARQLRNRFGIIAKSEDMRKELKNGTKKHFIREPRIGDTIKSTYFNGIIIGENNDKSAFLILTTPYFYKQWLDKDVITEIDGYGRYLYDIDTNECDLDIRADKFRKYFMSSDYYTEKVTTSEEQLSNNKDNDSQSNSSKFDLSKVVYKSRRIK